MAMMPGRLGMVPGIPENPLSLSWHDSTWIPILNTANVMDYFSERSNPFFDRTCNNEIVKMQRLAPDQLQNMTGLEYVLLHVQEPILYVIRKQHRHSPQQVTPLTDYYIIAGVVYQAPDLASVLNSRLVCFCLLIINRSSKITCCSCLQCITYSLHLKKLQALQDTIQVKATHGILNHKSLFQIRPKKMKNRERNRVLCFRDKELICC
jgi:hypothetical protein